MKEQKTKVAYVKQDECISCQMCVIACPHQAIYMASNNTAEVNPELCHACKECIAVCPVSCISLKDKYNI